VLQVHPDIVDLSVPTDDASGSMGPLGSPLIYVEIGESALNPKLTGKFTLTIPHAFDETSDNPDGAAGKFSGLSDTGVVKDDIVVALNDPLKESWQIVPPSDYELVASSSSTIGLDGLSVRGSVAVRLEQPGIVGVFGKTDRPFKQRVLAIAFAPCNINPLESDRMRIHLVSVDQGSHHAHVCFAELQRAATLTVLLWSLCGRRSPTRLISSRPSSPKKWTNAASLSCVAARRPCACCITTPR
jgi:hypothetical protein